MNRIPVYFLFVILSLMLIFIAVKIHYEHKGSIEYFKNLNLKLVGKISDEQVASNDRGVLFVDVIKSNIKDYDIRSTGNIYYCIIHEDKAEIIQSRISDLYVGDSIIIDCYRRSFECYRKGKHIYTWPLELTQSDIIIGRIRKLHRL